ncbi:hypothetical protein [Alkalihalobacillus sp. AL-G]|uniref:LiaF transmembrane domain-containing protein n=1 Tax=Alkalihalobacillus sp. AL-G TaxID=2926399 RepID=UPI00272B5842|nr:hypothetical protein [Alkalihalobacillus sp. AL-G]WLD92268.1 hypothetical protein MOJ78_14730 [Alkalihalobacillus sp. AL-G]
MNQAKFPAMLLIGIGVYFLSRQWGIPFIGEMDLLPALLLIMGIGFLMQGNDPHALFSGIVICGLAVHFYARTQLTFWPDKWAVYTLIVGIAFLVQAKKTKQQGLLIGGFLTILSLFAILSTGAIGIMGEILSYTERLWPALLALIGIYMFLKNK